MRPDTLISWFLLQEITFTRVAVRRENIGQLPEWERRYLLDPDKRNGVSEVPGLSFFHQIVVDLAREDDNAPDLGRVLRGIGKDRLEAGARL